MATLYIAEFGGVITGRPPMANVPALVEQTVAIGAEADSAAFSAATTYVRLHADAICSVQFGAAPTATTATMRLAAGQTEYFAVTAGHKVSVITNT